MKILITGGNGYLGRNLARFLVNSGHKVCLPVRIHSDISKLEDLSKHLSIKRFNSRKELEQIIINFKPESLIHLACSYGRGGESDIDIIEANLVFGLSLLEILKKLEYSINFINTDTCLQPNLNSYTLSKSQFVSWGKFLASIENSKLTFINIRLQQFFGPGDDKSKLPGHVLHACNSNNKSLSLTEGTQLRDFIYIEDVLNAFSVILKNIGTFKEFVEIQLGTGKSITVREFVQTIHTLTKSSTELLFGAIPSRKNEPDECLADPFLLISLGWKPEFSLVKGLKKTINLEFKND